jgi:phosphatidylglycerol lysyltransferase
MAGEASSRWATASGLGRAAFTRLRRVDRSVWSLAILALVGAFGWRQRHELDTTIDQLRTADVRWTLVVLASALAMHATYTITLSTIFATLGRRIPLRPALETYAERQTVATVVPFGALPSVVTLARRYAPYGVTTNDAIFAVVIYSLLGHGSFLAFMTPTLVYLIAHGVLTGVMAISAGAFVIILIGIATVVSRLARGQALPAWLERRVPASVPAFLVSSRSHRIAPRLLAKPFLLALTADCLGAIGVFAAIQAVGHNATIGAAAAGYVVGTLFLLIAPMFQGLGLVEVSMTLALQQLGVPIGHALGATLLYRLGEVWLPVIFGIALHARRQPRLRGLPARLPALGTGAIGLLAIASVMPHDVQQTMAQRLPHHSAHILAPHNAGRTLILILGFLFVACAFGLWRRQKVVWAITVAGSGLLTAVLMSRDIDRLAAILAAANLGLLLIYRKRFRVRSDVPTMRRALLISGAVLTVALAYGTFSLWLVDRRQFGAEFSIGRAFSQALDALFSIPYTGLEPRTVYARWLLHSFQVVGALTVVIIVAAVLRPVVWRRHTAPAERDRALTFIAANGRSSLDEFRTWPDKQQFFSSSGDGVISYGLARGVALCLGDPVATDMIAARRVLGEFLDLCEINAWEPAFHQASGPYLPLYRAEGLTPLKIGAEAVVMVEAFSLEGKRMKHLRNVRNKLEREGFRIDVLEPPIAPDVISELRAVSNGWLTLPGRRERGFTLGRFTDEYVGACTILALRDDAGMIQAFLNQIPDGVPGEVTFDMMRHRPTAPNGAMDALMLFLFAWAKDRGATRVSLGMVPFVDVGPRADHDRRAQTIALLSKPLGRFFDSASLQHFKDKFSPDWEPRYLVYRRDLRLPAIGLAIVQLTEESGDISPDRAPRHLPDAEVATP